MIKRLLFFQLVHNRNKKKLWMLKGRCLIFYIYLFHFWAAAFLVDGVMI